MIIRFHQGANELQQILSLQEQNHRDLISREEYEKEGFVTIKHTINELEIICGKFGHTVAIDSGKVVGYALTMLSEHHQHIPGLGEMVDKIQELTDHASFLIMGQICIAKPYRGQGVFSMLYEHMKLSFSSAYSGIYTEIDEDNPRSIRAHEKAGFEIILKYHNLAGKEWNLVYWDWEG